MLGHFSLCSPGSEKNPVMKNLDFHRKQLYSMLCLISYHSENGVRAAAPLVHFCLSIVTVLYKGSLCTKTLVVTKSVIINMIFMFSKNLRASYFLLYGSRPVLVQEK